MADRHRVLEQLVDDEDLDAVLAMVTLDEIAVAWCAHRGRPHDRLSDTDDPDQWASDLFFTDEVFRRADLYRSLLLKLVEHAPSDDLLGAVGAGPLENFVSDDEDDLRWLESHCRTNRGLRIALSGVWCWSDVSNETMHRLDVAAGVPLARPRDV
jgi:hypothetical protein